MPGQHRISRQASHVISFSKMLSTLVHLNLHAGLLAEDVEEDIVVRSDQFLNTRRVQRCRLFRGQARIGLDKFVANV